MSVSLAFPPQYPPQPILVEDPETGLPVEKIPRPFVPLMVPEDLEMAEKIGILTPRGTDSSLDDQKLIDDIDFLQMMDDQENIADEATEWLEEQIHLMNDQDQIVKKCNIVPKKTSEVVQITRVLPMFSIGALNGHSCVYLPWGSETGEAPGIRMDMEHQRPIQIFDLLYVDLVWNPQGRNFWKATKIHPKLPAQLISEVDVEILGVYNQGHQYTYNIALNPEDIKFVIGKSGSNINRLISSCVRSEMITRTHDAGIPGPLPEVTITPIDNSDEDHINSFIPTMCQVRVLCPSGCPWTKEDVEKLVSHLHC
tara:strand:+ start:128 stop:1060 length:933 start_codon:yes stop_codon:yes gene_type:complete